MIPDEAKVETNGEPKLDPEFEQWRALKARQAQDTADVEECGKLIQAALEKFNCAIQPFNVIGVNGSAIPNARVVKLPPKE